MNLNVLKQPFFLRVFFYCIKFSARPYQSERKSQCSIQWVGLGCRNQISGIELEYVQLEPNAYRKIFSITFQLVLIEITSADKELVVIYIFCTYRPIISCISSDKLPGASAKI